jgi:GAF domain-containing protein
MSNETTTGNSGDPADVIARQQAEIERLNRRIGDERFAQELREAFALASSVGAIGSPLSHQQLLRLIVETAADVITARAGSLFLIDHDTEELVFEVATGPKADEVMHFRVPLGQGIAGFVAVTGQPMAIADVQQDPRHASDIAESIGYRPNSILCVPLMRDDHIIGVLELLDKEDGNSFNARDLEVLGLFAQQAAVAIEQSRTSRNLVMLIGEVLGVLGVLPPEERPGLAQRAQEFALSIEEDSAYQQTVELARLVQEIAAYGANERVACQTLLEGFAGYLRARAEPLGDFGVMR